jgi:hypothetical protein
MCGYQCTTVCEQVSCVRQRRATSTCEHEEFHTDEPTLHNSILCNADILDLHVKARIFLAVRHTQTNTRTDSCLSIVNTRGMV